MKQATIKVTKQDEQRAARLCAKLNALMAASGVLYRVGYQVEGQ